MAQLGLAVGGALVGGAFGQAGFGWLAGSLLGAWLFSPTQNTPKLEDDRFSVDVYGNPLPIGYGTEKFTGIPIWGTGRIAHKQEESAKGGPSYEYYTYTASFAVAICAKQSADVLRIWVAGKLVYDIRGTDAGVESEVSNKGINFNFYDGTQTTADPVMEANLGAGNVPAHKGITYIVFDNLPLEDYGNMPYPPIEAEITFSDTDAYPYEVLVNPAPSANDSLNFYLDDNLKYMYAWGWSGADRSILYQYNAKTGEQTGTYTLPSGYIFDFHTTMNEDMDGNVWVGYGTQGYNARFIKFNPEGLIYLGGVGVQAGKNNWRELSKWSTIKFYVLNNKKCGVISDFAGNIFIFSANQKDNIILSDFQFYGAKHIVTTSITNIPPMTVQDKNGILWMALDDTLAKIPVDIVNNPDNIIYPGTDYVASINHINYDISGTFSDAHYLIYNKDNHSLIINSQQGGVLAIWDIDTEAFTATTTAAVGLHQHVNWAKGIQNGKILVGGLGTFELYDADDLTLLKTYNINDYDFSYDSDNDAHVWHEPSSSMWALNESRPNKIVRYYFDRKYGGTADLADIVEDLCTYKGRLASADVDVSDLVGTVVRGYKVARQTSASGAINSLIPGFFFDGFESDWKLKFTERPQSSSFSIPDAHLGLLSDQIKLDETYQQESELPERVNVSYADYDKDYHINTQTAKRIQEAIRTRQEIDIQVPVVFTANEAARIAEKHEYIPWVERVKFATVLPPRYLILDPSDVGTITLGSNTFNVRLLQIDQGANLAISLEAVSQDDEAYTSTATGYAGDGSGQDNTITIPDETEMFIMDIPYLLDEFHTNGAGAPIYFGFAGKGDNWSGAFLFRSLDTYTYNQTLTSLNEITYGIATTKLHGATYADGREFWATLDKTGTVTVDMINGTLSSVTYLQMLSGMNAAALKSGDNWEVIQFQTATDNGDATYTLSKLLRGRRGTNKWIGDHAAGDTFILLDDETIKRYVAANTDIDVIRYYKALTLGGVFEIADWDEFTLAANAYKPYSPCHIAGTRDGSSNLTITWIRRTRVGGVWRNNTGSVPLAEESEEYEVDILDSGGAVVRTIDSITSETTTYSEANQTTDFGSAQSSISVKVYQLNAIVGRGFAGEATI